MPPKSNVTPISSATAKTQPHQAGMRDIPQDLPGMLSRIVTTLREATVSAINPRIDPSTAAALNARSLGLQQQLHTVSEAMDQVLAKGEGQLGVYQDLNTIGGQVQDFTQAVVDALEGVNELQTSGSIQVHSSQALSGRRKLGALTPEQQQKRTWILFGAGAAAVLAGVGIMLVVKHKSPKPRGIGRIHGAIPSR